MEPWPEDAGDIAMLSIGPALKPAEGETSLPSLTGRWSRDTGGLA